MNTYEEFYIKSLYPLQDGILKLVNSLNTPFYLTGGTALSRGYYNHRYSDDLDFFVNVSVDFENHIKTILKILDDSSHSLSISYEVAVTAKSFFQIYIKQNETVLKVDFVNDIAVRYGDISRIDILGKIDSIENMITNKITALFRYEPKDIADIWIISKNNKFNWEDIINKARNKEVGVDPLIASEIIATFPIDRLNYIKWAKQIDKESIMRDLKQISDDILISKNNSLYK